MKEKKICFLGLKIEKDLLDNLYKFAETSDSSASRIARIAIKKYLKEQQRAVTNGQ